jgi:hypothetical protein
MFTECFHNPFIHYLERGVVIIHITAYFKADYLVIVPAKSAKRPDSEFGVGIAYIISILSAPPLQIQFGILFSTQWKINPE